MSTLLGRYSRITHTHPFNGSFPRTTQVSRYQKGKTNLDWIIGLWRIWVLCQRSCLSKKYSTLSVETKQLSFKEAKRHL